METLLYCAVGAILCAGWVYVQFKVFEWAEEKGTFFARLISKASLVLLSLAITLVSFTAFITLYFMFVMPAFGG
ncbi:MAG: hypothetical protein K2Y39_15930 [Candidatus Obscuribacterales bacterium]|nr:hypothetical protein [Candidatus Obscuribacterales bacterium]